MMNLNGIDDNTPPDFVNDKGIKWWKCPVITEWAHRKNLQGISLPAVDGWLCEEPSGKRMYVITDGQDYEFESQGLEDAAVHIDIMKTDKLVME